MSGRFSHPDTDNMGMHGAATTHAFAVLTGINNACSQFSDVSPPAVNGYFWRLARNLRCAAIGHTACDLLACVY